MHIMVNGMLTEFTSETLERILQRYGISPSSGGVAVALNEQVIPRHQWHQQTLRLGDRVEIIHAVQGG